MLLTLFWLTLSIPFVYKAQQQIVKEKIAAAQDKSTNDEESSGNPLSNTNEEKSSNSFNTLSEEYLHHHTSEELSHYRISTNHLHHAQESTYIAFHGEMLCPPPNA
ncbi:MAG: hypothetical protein JSS70_00030 [Bacteroidetes bacterium]|nr:hypothetical protein [Bacteroidota bacterium]